MNNADTTPHTELIQALDLILNHVDFNVFVTEIGGETIIFANHYFKNRFGDDCVGRHATELLDVPPSLFGANPGGAQETYCDKTAEWLSLTASDLAWPSGGAVRIFTCRIVTARKLLAEVKKDADKVRDSFLDEARDEIGAPLKAIGGIADMIMGEYITPQVRNHAFRIKHAATTLLVAINELIDVSKNDSPQPSVSTRLSRYRPDPTPEEAAADPLTTVRGLDIGLGRENMSGSDKLYRQILAQYCSVSSSIRAQIIKSLGNRDLHNLIIHLHSLKSSTASIGAVALSYRAARLERAGRDADWATLDGDLGEFLDDWQLLVNAIWQALNTGTNTDRRVQGDPVLLKSELDRLKAALLEYDPNTADKILEQLKQHNWPDTVKKNLDSLADDILLSNFEQAEARVGAMQMQEV